MLFLEIDTKRRGKCFLCFYCALPELCCARKNCKEAKKARVPRLTFSKVFKRFFLFAADLVTCKYFPVCKYKSNI
jgi:hypothetical protein